MPDQVLTIDQGTHSTRAIVFDTTGKLISSAQQSIALHRHSRVEIEQSADEILQSMQTVVAQILDDPAIDRNRLCSAGLATQRSSVLGWDRQTGSPLSPVLSWQDRRSADDLSGLADQGDMIQQLTGLHLSPHYGASKLQWLLENNAAVKAAMRNNSLRLGPLASFLLHHLTESQNDCVDHANASRTLLWNLETRNWDSKLCDIFKISLDELPACRPICSDFGLLTDAAIPLTATNGDQTAALYSQGQPDKNCLYVNMGTGAFVILPVEDLGLRPDGLLAGICNSQQTSADYYLEGTVNSAAAALKWVAARYKLDNIERNLPGWLDSIKSPPLFINTLGGLGSPLWKNGPAAYFTDTDITAEEAMVAAVESIVFLIQANLIQMLPVNPAINRIRISGGLANLDAVCQKLADLSGLNVDRPVLVEATARGIAWLAADGPLNWAIEDPGQTFTPHINKGLSSRYQRFLDIVRDC